MNNIPSSSNGGLSNLQTLQHYLQSNNNPSSSSEVPIHCVKNEQHNLSSQHILNNQVIPPDDHEEKIEIPDRKMFWLVVELEATRFNKYFLVEAGDVIGYQDLDIINTGKLVYVNLKGKLRRCNVVMASGERKYLVVYF